MKAVLLRAPEIFAVETVEIPHPATGEVLVKVEASPINPSDIGFLKGFYSCNKPYPSIAGFEGSGTVVANGGGLLGWSLVGKRVGFAVNEGPGGTWAEYVTVPAKNCIKLTPDIPFTLGCCMLVNPLTVMFFADMIKQGRHQAVVQTAACSALGKMMVRYCLQQNIPIINIVRRNEQVETLREIGAVHILNSTEQGFEEELKRLSANLHATIAFECVSGELTGIVVNNMPDNSVIYLYGAMSMAPVEKINPAALIFSNKRLEGLWLTNWIKGKSLYALWRASNKVLSLLTTVLRSDVSREFPIDQVENALDFYKDNMSSGKVILRPSLSS